MLKLIKMLWKDNKKENGIRMQMIKEKDKNRRDYCSIINRKV